MNLNSAPAAYDPKDQNSVRRALQQLDSQARKDGEDIDLSRSGRLYLSSPNGSRWQITVSNSGAVTATSA